MRKPKHGLLLSAIVLGVSFLFLPSTVADTVDFPVSVTLPAATGVSIVATEIDAATQQFGPQVNDMNFDPLTFDATFGIWRPDHFYAVDVGATGGAGAPDVTVTYGSESNPAGQTTGIGLRATAAFTLVTGGPAPEDQTETDLVAHGPIKLLDQLSGGEVFDETELAGGFMRCRVGLYDGGDPALNALGGLPFTNADLAGLYAAVLSFTATVD